MREVRNLFHLHPEDLTRRQRLVLVYAFGLVSTVLVLTFAYWWGMRALENEPRTVYRSFNAVVATLTTTGYGADAPYQTPAMNLMMVSIQLAGVAIGFITLRVLVIPLFERAPLELDDRLSLKDDHVVVAGYQRDTEVLLDELEALEVDYVLLEPDEEAAKHLSDEGYQAINGDPEDVTDLDRASIEEAGLLVTDAGDRTASVVLTALEANEDLRVVSFTPSTRREAALTRVGVDRSVAPNALIGRRLAQKATTPVSVDPTLEGDEVAVREVLVRRDSPLHGARVGDVSLADRRELTLIAGWFDGELRMPVSPDDRLTADTVLVIAGPEGAIDGVSDQVAQVRHPRHSTGTEAGVSVVVAGLDEGGSAAVDALPDNVSATTVDESPDADPDVVGDVTEPETLRAAGIEDAAAVIVTVDDDATALLTVAMARSLADDTEVLACVSSTDKAAPAFRAGADYVLSTQRVCARLVAAEARDERVMDPVGQIRLVRHSAAPFAGESLGDVRRDAERRWTVVGLSRDGSVHTDERTTVEAEDEVFVAGGDAAIREFERTVNGS
jgi:Trk K+ transport system NAD-binding subunit